MGGDREEIPVSFRKGAKVGELLVFLGMVALAIIAITETVRADRLETENRELSCALIEKQEELKTLSRRE